MPLNAALAILGTRATRCCVALINIDYFASYVETYGDAAGDDALESVATEIAKNIRRDDAVHRYGEDAFLCVFTNQSMISGRLATKRMQLGVQHLAIRHTGSPTGLLAITAGLAMLDQTSAAGGSNL